MFSKGLEIGCKKGSSVGLGVIVFFQPFDLNLRAESVD
jgi:hypothetical protein